MSSCRPAATRTGKAHRATGAARPSLLGRPRAGTSPSHHASETYPRAGTDQEELLGEGVLERELARNLRERSVHRRRRRSSSSIDLEVGAAARRALVANDGLPVRIAGDRQDGIPPSSTPCDRQASSQPISRPNATSARCASRGRAVRGGTGRARSRTGPRGRGARRTIQARGTAGRRPRRTTDAATA